MKTLERLMIFIKTLINVLCNGKWLKRLLTFSAYVLIALKVVLDLSSACVHLRKSSDTVCILVINILSLHCMSLYE